VVAVCTSGDQAVVVPDRVFDEPRLAGIYDLLDPDRSDLAVYASIARELGSRSVVDIGCGTGAFACLLADDGLEVVGVDPAAAMLEVARGKLGADRVRWVHGVARDLPPIHVDLATMTGNVAQVFLDDDEWADALRAAHRVLRPGGWLVFESRRPEREAWLEWNREVSFQTVDIAGVGVVESWYEVLDVTLPFVTFRGTIVFGSDGSTLTSDSTLRFRGRDEIVGSLEAAGFRVGDVRDAPDRPGNEHVFLAERP
jgi:ubiquinone/menaquinone biosynthesis C-methylase UbiE